MADDGRSMEERHFREVTSVLPVFDPVVGDLTIEQWIEKLEEYGDLYNWDEIAVRHYALSKLTGVARKWRDSLPRVERSWLQWKELLQDNFPSDQSMVGVRLEAQNYKKKPSQDITEYFYEKLARCNRANMGDRESIEWIVDGLNNQRFKDYLGPLGRYRKPSELLTDLRSASAHFKEGPTVGERRASGASYHGQQQRCFTCKQVGHTARFCTKTKQPITCFKCGNSGHYSRSCPTKTQPGHSNSNEQSVKNTQSAHAGVLHISGDSHQKYFKDAFINGQPIKCYVDLGSSVVALRQDVANELHLTYHETILKSFIGYGEGRVQPLGVLTANISIDDVEVRAEVHIVPNGSQAVPLLVGHPYTEHPEVVIISRVGELRVTTASESFINSESQPVSKTTFRADGMHVIPNNYLGHIVVAGDLPNQDLCVEGGIREKGPIIPRCIVATDEQGKAILPVLNVTGQELTITLGDTLTRGEVCEEQTHDAELSCEREVNKDPVTLDQINTDLTGEEALDLVTVINNNRDLIANNLRQIGKTDKAKMRIELTSEKPVVYRPYRLSFHERQQLKDMISDLKTADIIEDSISPFASPVLLVRKKNGEMRVCVDYRAVNKLTVKDKYPLPRVDDQLDRLRGQRYYTSLDLFSGYYQVAVETDSREKTAFVTPDGQFQFKRMPFGLCNAPAVFQRLINTVLGSLRYDIAMAYLDDVIIPSMSIEEGLNRLIEVFKVFRSAGLTINLKKCNFFKSQIEYLGFEVSAIGIQPSKRKLESVNTFPEPKNVRDVRSFIGLASYFRRFVKNFAILAKPLTDLLRKNVKFCWSVEQTNAFNSIKKLLISKPILTIYNHNAETQIHTDACAIGLGAVLLQKQPDGKRHPVSFYSRKTTPEEAQYHSYELEALAIVCALEKFRVYLIGIHFVIKTDCNSLKMLENKRDLNPRIGRWFVRLSEFDYTIEYHKGESNKVADSLSRNPVNEGENMEVIGLPILGVKLSTDWIAAMQRADPDILSVRDLLEAGNQKVREKFTMYNARVYKISKGRWRLYVPSSLRYEVVSEAHRTLAHLGIEKTLAKLKEEYYFPKMRDFVTSYINRCIACLYCKVPTGKKPGFLHPLDKGNTPFQSIHIDHLGPLPETEYGNKYVAAIICGYSKYVILKAVRDVGAESTLKFMREFMSHYGKPTRIISDRGTAFTAKVFESFCNENDIQHVKIATGTPRANGQIERINSVITRCLSASTDELTGEDWDKRLYEVQWAINSSQHKVTQRTPYDIVFNYKVTGWNDSPLTVEIRELNTQLGTEEEKTDVAILLDKNKDNLSKQFNKNRVSAREYKVGDIVLQRSEPPATGESRKLLPKYRGPYEIAEILGNDRYVVRDIEGEQQSQRLYQGIVAAERLKFVSSAKEYVNRAKTRSKLHDA